MPTSQGGFISKPRFGERVPLRTIGYVVARTKRHAYNLVIKEFKASGITKAELARRLGVGADRVSRLLAGPANWTLATAAQMLFAISGKTFVFASEDPLNKARRNDTQPIWREIRPPEAVITATVGSISTHHEDARVAQ